MKDEIAYVPTLERETFKHSRRVHRRHRQKRIWWAWGSSLSSKIANVGVQLIAVPLVYRALGQGGYAAYAAVTASAGLMGALNLGIGGSLVTPIAEATSRSDRKREALLVQAGLVPLLLMCFVGAVVVMPVALLLPLRTLYGTAAAKGPSGLRVAALIAVSATLASVPVSSIVFLRQAYQEMHVTNIIGSVANLLLCGALVLAASRSQALPLFVGIFLVLPLAAQLVNLSLLVVQRPYLLRNPGKDIVRHSRELLGDGLRFIGADFSYVMVYQWPIYWIARTMSVSDSALFAICMQGALLPLASMFGLLQPLWPSTADALARGDHVWLQRSVKRGRRAVVAIGICAVLGMSIFGKELMQIWLRKAVVLDWPDRTCIGIYISLAVWEYYHFMVVLGCGCLRKGAMAIFQRAVAFAVAVPLLTRIGGVSLLWCGMCCSIAFWTAWRLPRMVSADAAAAAIACGQQ